MFTDSVGGKSAYQIREEKEIKVSARKWFDNAVGTTIENDADVTIFTATMKAVIEVAGNEILNEKLSSRLIDPKREIKAGDTALDYYQRRYGILCAVVDRVKEDECPSESEQLHSKRMALCGKIVNFLKENGAKLSAELGIGPNL